MRTTLMVIAAMAGLVACGERPLDPAQDEDGDGITNGTEQEMGSDPYNADDVPYAGGWKKDADCRFDVQPTGNDEGFIAEDLELIDQFGEELHLHDFCGRVLLIESTAPT